MELLATLEEVGAARAGRRPGAAPLVVRRDLGQHRRRHRLPWRARTRDQRLRTFRGGLPLARHARRGRATHGEPRPGAAAVRAREGGPRGAGRRRGGCSRDRRRGGPHAARDRWRYLEVGLAAEARAEAEAAAEITIGAGMRDTAAARFTVALADLAEGRLEAAGAALVESAALFGRSGGRSWPGSRWPRPRSPSRAGGGRRRSVGPRPPPSSWPRAVGSCRWPRPAAGRRHRPRARRRDGARARCRGHCHGRPGRRDRHRVAAGHPVFAGRVRTG